MSQVGFSSFGNQAFFLQQQQLRQQNATQMDETQVSGLQLDVNAQPGLQGQQTKQDQSQEATAVSGVDAKTGVENGEQDSQGMSAGELQGRLQVSQGQKGSGSGSGDSALEQKFDALRMEVSQRVQFASQSRADESFNLSMNALERGQQSIFKFREDVMEQASQTGELPKGADKILDKVDILQNQIDRGMETTEAEMKKKEEEKDKYKIENKSKGGGEALYTQEMDNNLSDIKNVSFNAGPGSRMM